MNALLSAVPQLFNWTLQTSAQAACLAVLVLGLQKLLGRKGPHKVRYALGLLIVFRLLLPVAPASPLSLENLLWRKSHAATAPSLAATLTAPEHVFPASGSEKALTPLKAEQSLSWGEVFGYAWACGVLVLASIAAWRYRRWQRLIRSGKQISDPRLLSILDQARQTMGVRRSVTLVSVPEVESPAVFGVWRVCLLLPEGRRHHLDEGELRLIFMHEMAHVRRHDGLLDLILMGLQFLHWFNPLVWLTFHWLRAERELVCDAMVIHRSGETERLNYGRLLIRMADSLVMEGRTIPAAIPVIGRKCDIKRRILAIMDGQTTSWSSMLTAGVGGVTVVCLTFTGATQPMAPPQTATVRLYRGERSVGEQTVVLTAGKILLSSPPAMQATQSYPAPLNPLSAAGLVTATDGIVLKHGDNVLKAGEISVDLGEGTVVARGEVSMSLGKRGDKPGESLYSLTGSNEVLGANEIQKEFEKASYVIDAKELRYAPQAGQVLIGGASTSKRDGLTVNGNQPSNHVQTKEATLESRVAEVDIRFVGPQLVEEQEIRTKIQIKVGSPFDLENVDGDVKRLYATGHFYRVRASKEKTPSGTKVTYLVQCNLEVVGIQFKGNTVFTEAELQKLITCKTGDRFSERRLSLDAQKIQKEYKRTGHQGTMVKSSTVLDEMSGKAKVTFEITEPQ